LFFFVPLRLRGKKKLLTLLRQAQHDKANVKMERFENVKMCESHFCFSLWLCAFVAKKINSIVTLLRQAQHDKANVKMERFDNVKMVERHFCFSL